MTYSKTTNFAVKDNLLTGDANKIIKGVEINVELDNIQTAVNYVENTLLALLGSSGVSYVESQTATVGQTVFTLTTGAYVRDGNSLHVLHNGLKLTYPTDYTETSTTVVTLTDGTDVSDGDRFSFVVTQSTSRAIFSAADFGFDTAESGANNTTALASARAAAGAATGILISPGTYAVSGAITGKFYSFGAVTITGGSITSITNLVP